MDVETCIRTYRDLAKVVFKPRFSATAFQRAWTKLNQVRVKPTFSSKNLEDEIKKIVGLYSVDKKEDASFYDPDGGCKV